MSNKMFLISLGATTIITGSLVAALAVHRVHAEPGPYMRPSTPALSARPIASGRSPRETVSIEIGRMCRNLAACDPGPDHGLFARTCAAILTKQLAPDIAQVERAGILPQFARALSVANDRCATRCDDLESCFSDAADAAIASEN